MILQVIQIVVMLFFGVGAVMLAIFLLGRVVMFWLYAWEWFIELAQSVIKSRLGGSK